MRSLASQELSLDSFNTGWIPKTVREFMGESSRIESESERYQKLDEYVNRLEDEMRKIEGFKRELPFCMLLLKNAILAVEEEQMRCKKPKPDPVLQEFMPLKKSCLDHTEEKSKGEEEKGIVLNADNYLKHSNSYNLAPRKLDINNKYGNKGPMERALVSLKGCSNVPSITTIVKEDKGKSSVVPDLTLSLAETKKSKEEIYINGFSSKYDSNISVSSSSAINNGHHPSRKQRRCWSTELHQQFLHALDELGGPKAATPKQLRERMQVDGLTNDEVKSHLQKYRLHNRKGNLTTTQRKMSIWTSEEQRIKSSKHIDSKSNSPETILHFPGGEIMEDEKSENHRWKVSTSG